MRMKWRLVLATVLFVALASILYDTRQASYFGQRNTHTPTFGALNKRFFIDLSSEYEETKHLVQSFDVMEALKLDGYSPKLVSVTQATRTERNAQISRSHDQSDNIENVNGIKSELSSNSVSEDSATKYDSKSRSKWQSRRKTKQTPRSERMSQDQNEEATQITSSSTTDDTQLILRVPNVVHYVFLGTDLNFTFTNYLSYMSVDRFIRPDQIFVHGDHTPSGKWWDRTINEVKNIYHVNRTYSNAAPNGQLYRYPAHISDYMRAETLLRYGGIYLDADVLIVKSFDELRRFPFVIGREAENAVCNGILVAERGALFLRLLLEQYHSYAGPKEKWSVKSVLNIDKLVRIYPHLVHVEEKSLNRPNWREVALIYDGRYDWSQSYSVHLWTRTWPKTRRPNGVEDVLTQNTTFAELARLAMFRTHEIRKN